LKRKRSEQQDGTRNVAECDSEKAAVTDAQETTANEQTKPSTKRRRLNSKITGKNIKLLNKFLVDGTNSVSSGNIVEESFFDKYFAEKLKVPTII
jgi:antitoxin component YwqK of YwqJK toxin-antitoxin module